MKKAVAKTTPKLLETTETMGKESPKDEVKMTESTVNGTKNADIEGVEGVETKAFRFKRIAEQRCNAALKKISLMKNLSNRSAYEFTQADVDKVIGALEAEVAALKAAFANADKKHSQIKLF